MNSVFRLMVAAAVSVAAIVSASAETPAGRRGRGAKGAAAIPTLHCEFKAMSACSPDGDCKEGNEVAGIKVPVKVTVDFENSVVSAVDDVGLRPHRQIRRRRARPPTSSSCTASTARSAGSSCSTRSSGRRLDVLRHGQTLLIGGFGTRRGQVI